MKKSFLILIILFGILSCNAQNQREKEEKTRIDINVEFDKNVSECPSGTDLVTDFNKKNEFWDICNLDNGNRIIKIQSHKTDTFYQEIYFEKNGDLICAKETEKYMPKNQFTKMIWNCEFYAKKGELISLMSLGHGKTEDDKWNPEIIFEMYKKRIAELNQIKK